MTTMHYCSTSWNPGCCSLHNRNAVTFDNLKTKYSVREDIRVEYTLHGHMQQASTRDWIGIFPRGWNNLQQYLTFEYAVVAPRTACLPNRAILFPRVFHQEASSNIEYQFVYVSREIKVLAMSPFFRLIRDDEATRILRVPCSEERTSAGEIRDQIYANPLPGFGCAPPQIVLSDQNLSSFRPSGTVPTNPRLPRSCKSCGKPRDNGCRFVASSARFLATHNASLAERVLRLERELALGESVRCNLSSRLRSYEIFVAEMLRSLATKRAVKITDASGKEMMLQQISDFGITGEETLQEKSNERSPKGRDDLPENVKRPNHDRVSTDGCIVTDKLSSAGDDRCGDEKIQRQLPNDCADDFTHQTPSAIDVATQTRSGYLLSSDEPLPSKSLEDINPCADVNDESTIEVTRNCNESTEEGGEKSADDIASREIVTVDASAAEVRRGAVSVVGGGWTDPDGDIEKVDEDGKTLKPKPSAIMIQGSNVKFAIIRY